MAPLALTMGEPAGIGGEIALMAWQARHSEGMPPFFLIDCPMRVKALASCVGLDVPTASIREAKEALACFDDALPILPIEVPDAVLPGRPISNNASAVIASIEKGVTLACTGDAAAVVTNPIHKKCLYDAGFRHPGHTEFLAALVGLKTQPIMMLACPGLRVVPVTVHLPLAKVAESLTQETILHAGRIAAEALRQDFAIEHPRLAMAGLNPHAGEDGALGREEIDIIVPAAERLRRDGIAVIGPLPADSLFHAAAREGFDAAICMYHDQALIPLKTISFDNGVNITLGLPFVRTSPDHGTAFAIAGQGSASPHSLIAALRTAATMARARSNRAGEANHQVVDGGHQHA